MTEYHRHPVDVKQVIGMQVKDVDDEVLGKVNSLEIHPKKLRLEAILVNTGFLEQNVLIGREYVKSIGRKYVQLNIDLTLLIEDKKVIDSDGEQIGIVAEVDRVKKTNKLGGIRVKTDSGMKYFNKDKIKEIQGDSVFLKPNA